MVCGGHNATCLHHKSVYQSNSLEAGRKHTHTHTHRVIRTEMPTQRGDISSPPFVFSYPNAISHSSSGNCSLMKWTLTMATRLPNKSSWLPSRRNRANNSYKITVDSGKRRKNTKFFGPFWLGATTSCSTFISTCTREDNVGYDCMLGGGFQKLVCLYALSEKRNNRLENTSIHYLNPASEQTVSNSVYFEI